MAEPTVSVEIEGERCDARARVVDADVEEEEEDRARTLIFSKYAPRTRDDLTGWRQRALPIALDLPAPLRD